MSGDARVRKEVEALSKDFELSGVKASPVGGALTHLLGSIRGPKDSPFEGGIFEVDIVLPRDYPFAPPAMKFTTRLWHPNVSSQTGAICLDIIKKGPESAWSPALTIKTALLSLQALLSAPEPNDPQDAEVASQYKRDYKEWAGTAKYWTDMYVLYKYCAVLRVLYRLFLILCLPCNRYARPSSGVSDGSASKVAELMKMGFDEAASKRALAIKHGNLEQAVEMLLASI
jgi:ubiquitin-conjugating enzyme (huntingtin interacting protein 2)